MGTLKPFAQAARRAAPSAALWVKRRTFLRHLGALIGGSSISISPAVTTRQTHSGLFFQVAPGFEEALPFQVAFVGENAVSVAPGVVDLAGSLEPFILEATSLPVGGSGFVAVVCSYRLPQWYVDHDYGYPGPQDFAGWVEIDDAPVLDFVSGPVAMSILPDWVSPMNCDPIPVAFPIAFVDPDNNVIHRLCNTALGIGPSRAYNSGSLSTDVSYVFE
jgi:hypothetical protein